MLGQQNLKISWGNSKGLFLIPAASLEMPSDSSGQPSSMRCLGDPGWLEAPPYSATPSEFVTSLVSVAGKKKHGDSHTCSSKLPPKSDTRHVGWQHCSKLIPWLCLTSKEWVAVIFHVSGRRGGPLDNTSNICHKHFLKNRIYVEKIILISKVSSPSFLCSLVILFYSFNCT